MNVPSVILGREDSNLRPPEPHSGGSRPENRKGKPFHGLQITHFPHFTVANLQNPQIGPSFLKFPALVPLVAVYRICTRLLVFKFLRTFLVVIGTFLQSIRVIVGGTLVNRGRRDRRAALAAPCLFPEVQLVSEGRGQLAAGRA
jgi:hypothetical protein